MLFSRALAAHGVVDTGSSGGANALLIILGIAIVLGAVYVLQKRLRNRRAGRDNGPE
ncbi:MAG: hypothetical protein R3229_04130 [Alphaproteobacteria bacterium]|nr:hypothetical protein [Alphaproteobacteria bacterium]